MTEKMHFKAAANKHISLSLGALSNDEKPQRMANDSSTNPGTCNQPPAIYCRCFISRGG